MKQPIILIGFMGAGKTTVGSLLAKTYNLPFYDLDHVFQARYGDIAQFWQTHGEAAFREKEKALLEEIIHEPAVIATGGGVITQAANRLLLQQQTNVVYLKAKFMTCYQRICRQNDIKRPLVDKQLNERFRTREQYYEACARFTFSTNNVEPQEVVTQIAEACAIQ